MLFSGALLPETRLLSLAIGPPQLRCSHSYIRHGTPFTGACVKYMHRRTKASSNHTDRLQTSDAEDDPFCSGSQSDCYIMADDDIAGLSFRRAFHNSAPPIIPDDLAGIQLNGIQQFAAAIWDRQKNIPSRGQKPPLERIFDAFDADHDGHLSPSEVAAALRSRGVDISETVARKFVEASDANNNGTVEKDEFGILITLMATADLRVRQNLQTHDQSVPLCEGDCEIEWDDNGEVRFPTAPHCQPNSI